MRIGIDARLAGLANRGLGRYLENFLKNLETLDKKNQYVVFLYKNNYEDYSFTSENFIKVKTNFRWYTIAEQLFFPLLIRRYKINFMYYPHFNIPLFTIRNFGLTLHDLTLLHYPDRREVGLRRATTLTPFFYNIKYSLFKILQKFILKKAKFIIVPSNYVKNDVLNYYQINADKIQVIYEGVTETAGRDLKFDLKKFGLTKPYLFYIGAAFPHKNLERLVKAFLIINKSKRYQLVISGGDDFFMKRLREWTKNINLEENEIIFTGFLDDQALANFYLNAEIFIMPSLSEGFGLPAVEAQAAGLPVVASDQASLKEILGKGAIFFNPFDLEDMSNKINFLLSDHKLQEKLKKNGTLNIKRFSWLKMTEEILSLIYNFDKN